MITTTTPPIVTPQNIKSVMQRYGLRFRRCVDEGGLILVIDGIKDFAGDVQRCHEITRGYLGAYEVRGMKGQIGSLDVHDQTDGKIALVQNAIKAYNLTPKA